jgi:hypothetical protein
VFLGSSPKVNETGILGSLAGLEKAESCVFIMNYLKGNLHTHTDASDGDSPLGEVARWYDDHGYDFLVITDHNVRLSTQEIQNEFRAEGRRLLLIPGEELTAWWQGPERVHALHIGGIDTPHTLGASSGESVVEVLQAMIDRVVEAGGMPSLNHPNFWDSIGWRDIAELDGLTHFEVYNGHPLAFNSGTERLPSMDAVWDILLSAGRTLYGIAVDDAHHFRSWGSEFSNPGRGWISMRAERSKDEIMQGLRAGRFFASTGPAIEAEVVGGELVVRCAEDSRIEFITQGEVVKSFEATEAAHPLSGLGYLRARVHGDDGVAWTQPIVSPESRSSAGNQS